MTIKISDCCITDDAIPQIIADKIMVHVNIGNAVAKNIGAPVWPSMKSGYRPYKYETSRGRSGSSQHCFRGQGAVDWTCDRSQAEALVAELIKSPYNRVCYYPNNNFVHADFKSAGKHFFICKDGRNWIRQK